jgi:metal-sulfur cluster biosynthetic enzyme/ribosomal protein L22
MGATLTAELRIDEPQLRVETNEARTALGAVLGRSAPQARARLRFGPGRTCEPVARLLDRAIRQAEQAGLDPDRLILAAAEVDAAEDIVRVRRKAHGKADWISSPTARIQLSLQPSGLHATAPTDTTPTVPAPPSPQPVGRFSTATVPADDYSADIRVDTIRAKLFDVIDPDLGINVVDLGFVRRITVDNRIAIITMTLTSAACPLTSIMEDQIRTELAPLSIIDDFRIDWGWLPAWKPADITDDGREQLRAIGFTL